MAKEKKGSKDATGFLGSGLARMASKLLGGRKKKVEQEIRKAVGDSMRKRKK